jgi:hypothetical protein
VAVLRSSATVLAKLPPKTLHQPLNQLLLKERTKLKKQPEFQAAFFLPAFLRKNQRT